jgi:acetyl-CoA synthetase
MERTSAHENYRSARDTLLGAYGNYDEAVSTFCWPTFAGKFNWAVDWFDAVARDNANTALWIVEEDGSEAKYSYADIARRSDQVARWLERIGVRQGDSVMLMLGNQVELWESMLAVMKLGAVLMPTTTAVGTDELVDRVARGNARAVIVNATDAAKFADVPGDYLRIAVNGKLAGWLDYRAAYDIGDAVPFESLTAPTDPLLYYFTSGTTSRPKLVEHTQVSYPVGHLSTMYFLGVRPGDVHLNISSPGWAKHAWSCFFAPWIAEATIFIYNYSRFDAKRLLAQIRRAEVTSFCAPPTVWRMLIQADLAGGAGKLREAIGAGEPLNPEVISHVQREWGVTIRDGFGQTETTAVVGNPPGSALKFGSMGRPLPGVPVVIVDPVTSELADEGEICLDLSHEPVNLMSGYVNDEKRTAQVTRGGFYHTGDVATRDGDGYITYVGRTDDVFKASDYKISPFELESVVIEHPAVAEAAVVPAPDPTRLAVPKAYVSLAEGWEPDQQTAYEILKYAREKLAPYQRIRRIEFLELPKTMSGKIKRVELRQREEQATKPFDAEFRDDQFPELRSASASHTGGGGYTGDSPSTSSD